jgi:single-strand DNA-binding protein
MMNRVVIVGRLTKEPELKYTPNSIPVCTFTLAVNRPFSNQGGEREADFINCVVWRKPAENAANYLKKGSLCGVDGRIQTRNFDGQDGKKVYITEVVAESVQFLERKPQNGENSGGNYQSNTNTPQNNQNQNAGHYGSYDNNGIPDISPDDLPF